MDHSTLSSELDTILKQYVNPEKGILHGAAFVVVDNHGQTLSSNAQGKLSPDPLKQGVMKTSSLCWVASMSKLITSVATMQVVERGLIGLDDDLGQVVSDLAEPDLLVGFEGENDGHSSNQGSLNAFTKKSVGLDSNAKSTRTPILRKAEKPITLRRLLTHSSGFTYDLTNEDLTEWSAYNGRSDHAFCGTMDGYRHPLIFSPGEGWAYGGGLDWAGYVVSKLTSMPLEEYMATNIWSRLGMKSTTFHPENRPDLRSDQMELGWRGNGPRSVLEPTAIPFAHPAQDDLGGVGLFTTAEDYAKVLAALVSGGGALLSQSSVDELLKPQLADTRAFNEFRSGPGQAAYENLWSDATKGNHTLAGPINLTALPGRRAKNTVHWSGMPNLHWWIDRETGIAACLFVQVLPVYDMIVKELLYELEEAVYKHVRSDQR